MRHSTCFAARYRTFLNLHLRCTRACAVILGMGLAASVVLPAASQTLQPPDEEFYLQTVEPDSHHVYGVMDSKNLANVSTGFVQLNGLNDPSNPSVLGSPKSQWWRDILLLGGDGDSVKLKNDATGLCISNDGDGPVAPMVSCDSGAAIWQRILQSNGMVYRYSTVGSVLGATVRTSGCLGTDPELPGAVVVDGCSGDDNRNVSSYMVWSRTTTPINTVSTALTPPSVPPKKPTACKLDGAAVCGQVEFSCDALSASDKIVVSSGVIGVKVTSVQANIGMVNATYLNSGAARVSICATKPGAFACSTPIAVSFGSTTCTNPPSPPTQICPTGQEICRGVCSPFGTCMQQ